MMNMTSSTMAAPRSSHGPCVLRAGGGSAQNAPPPLRPCCAAHRIAPLLPRRRPAWHDTGAPQLSARRQQLQRRPAAAMQRSTSGGGKDGEAAAAAGDDLLQQLSQQAAGPSIGESSFSQADGAGWGRGDAARRETGAQASTSGSGRSAPAGSGAGGGSSSSSSSSSSSARQRFLRLAQLAERELEAFDIRYDVDRSPNVSERWRLEMLGRAAPRGRRATLGPGLSLTAMAIAAERAGRQPRQEVRGVAGRLPRSGGGGPAAWAAHLHSRPGRSQHAWLLRNALPAPCLVVPRGCLPAHVTPASAPAPGAARAPCSTDGGPSTPR
jgi:hypothetical protein